MEGDPAAERLDPVLEPGQTRPAAEVRAAPPIVADPDLQDIVASGDTVATRWVLTGSQQREFMGIPAAGQTITVEGMNFYRLKDGRVTDIWTQFDGVAMMRQLGATPSG